MESVGTIDSSNAGVCDNKNWTTRPDEGIAVRQTLVAWDARGWEFECNVGPWIVHDGANGPRHDVWTWWAFNRPCNTQWYRGEVFSAVAYDGQWHMGFQQFGNGKKTQWVFQP